MQPLVFLLAGVIPYLMVAQNVLVCETCVDIAPPTPVGSVPLSCQEQKEMGKCVRGWMEGYCECTCAGCEQAQQDRSPLEESQPVTQTTPVPLPASSLSVAFVVDSDVVQAVPSSAALGVDSDVIQVAPVTQRSPTIGEMLQELAKFPQQQEEAIPEASPVEACECYDLPPSASKKTCQDMLLENQCEVMLLYNYCECTCGKCAATTEAVAHGGAFESSGSYEVEELNSVELLDGQKLPNDMTVEQQDMLLADLVRTVTTMTAPQVAATTTTALPPAVVPQPASAVQSVVQQPATLSTVIPTAIQAVEVEVSPVPAVPLTSSVQAAEKTAALPAGSCVDILPPNSEFSCEGWKQQNRCDRTWMEGYCQFTCGKCGQSSDLVQLGGSSAASTEPAVVADTSAVTALLSSTPSYDDMCMSSCNDNPPPKSDFSCAEQVKMNKCERDWMSGYCECTCKTCDALHDHIQTAEEQKSIQNPELSSAAPQTIAVAPVPKPRVSGNADMVLTILHFNDIHARLMPATEWWWECEPWRNDQGECYGGFPRMKTIVDQHRSLEPNLLILNGGDDFVGTDWDYHDPTNTATTKFLNQIGVDAMAIGNHEFDHGPDTLATFARNANYPLLSCNMDASKEYNLDSTTQKYTIQQIQGHKVGIFGLTTTFTNTAKHADTRNVWFSDPNTAARQCVQELQNQGVDVIIALSHLGFSADKYLAKQIDGIDIVVGSHSHTFLTPDGAQGPLLNRDTGKRDNAWDKYPTWIWSDYGRRVPVVQAGWATRYLGKITLEIDSSGEVMNAYGAPILLGGSKSDNNVPEDPVMKQALLDHKWW